MKKTDPALADLLAAAVAAVDGEPRQGQQLMAEAVADALETGEHLLVQAGTGTGKSLAYLVPAVAHRDSVVIATATIALQRQLIDRDIPVVVEALGPQLGRRPTFAMLKGRSNYLCLHRLHSGEEEPAEQEVMFDPTPTSRAGRDVVRIRRWAEETQTGDRDELVPAPDDRAWRSLSVTPHECLGAQRCPHAEDCFTELARERAREADIVVTNHAMLAIDSLSDARLLPEVDVVVVDEAHELADRATGAVTDELTSSLVERAGRRSRTFAGADSADLLVDAAAALETALAQAREGRIDQVDEGLFDALVAVRDAGHDTLSAMATSGRTEEDDSAARVRAKAAVEDVFEIAGRLVAAGEHDVVWVTRSDRRPPTIYRAPLFVADQLREGLFDDRTVVMTSATLELGGGFEPIARNLGLVGKQAPPWRGLDVGSPFDYEKQAILYMAAHLPPPGREGLTEPTLVEMAELITAAGGRTLGLFSSMRAAQQAAGTMRDRLELPILCQGDDATGELVRQFAADAKVCLFGTLSLWQGVDVPGSALQLVLIDRLPFPRPDDPLASARQRFVESGGGNGFMAISATQASLRLAQGSGRLIRTATDKGVVAVLDSRLAKARYGGYVRASLPPMWPTTDGDLVRASLRAIDASARPILPVSSAMVAAQAATGQPPTDGGDRRRRRWTEADENALTEGWLSGTPPVLLADELGRTSGAIVSRLRSLGLVHEIEWTQLPVADEDRKLAYALAAVPASLLLEPDGLIGALELADWVVEPQDATTLRVHGDGVDALVGVTSADGLTLGEATSRWLVVSDSAPGEVPAGVNGQVTPRKSRG